MTAGVARDSRGAIVAVSQTSVLTTSAIQTAQAQCSPLQNRQRNDLMQKTALILAGAAVFDLGVMVVASQAQQAPLPPSSFQIGGSADPSRAVDMFLKIDRVNSVQACTARRGEVVMREGVQQCRLPGPAGSPDLRAAPEDLDIHKQGLALNFTKIDIHYTARACIAQRGEVVTRDGVQQCALPAAPGDGQPSPRRR